MAAKWVEKIKAHLAQNPLYFKSGEHKPTCQKCCGGAKPAGGKKLALYQVTNYSNLHWDTCSMCGVRYG